MLIPVAMIAAMLMLCGVPVRTQAKAKRVFSVMDGASGTFYGNGTITLKGIPGYFAGTSGTNTERVTVWRGSNIVVNKDYAYYYEGFSEDLKCKFTPLGYGKYTVRYAHVSDGALDYVKTAVINVVNPKKAKTVKPKFSLKADSGSVTLSGFDAKASTEIYRSSKKKGTFKLIETVKSDSFTDNTIKTGRNYYYKIRVRVKAGKMTYKTKKSAALTAYTGKPAKPVIKSVKLIEDGDGSLHIKWDKKNYDPSVKISVSYQENKSGGGRNMAVVPAEDGECTISLGQLPAGFCGKTYYFQLNAYRDNNWMDDMLSAKSSLFKYTVPDPWASE